MTATVRMAIIVMNLVTFKRFFMDLVSELGTFGATNKNPRRGCWNSELTVLTYTPCSYHDHAQYGRDKAKS
jgi:hypothetical protein